MPTGVDEHQLPIVTRWSTQALGTVEGPRVRRPRDPVAAWLLRRHPELTPTFQVPAVLCMIRARSAIVDRMLVEELHLARRSGQPMRYHRLGAGLDGRFYRLFRGHEDALLFQREVDEEPVMEAKRHMLASSSFARAWQGVQSEGRSVSTWTVPDAEGHVVVNLEGAATRLGLRLLVRVLGQIRRDSPRARVILDLPGFLTRTGSGNLPPPTAPTRLRWEGLHATGAGKVAVAHLKQLGWRVDEDSWFASRPELRASSGVAICHGVDGMRVLRLVAC